MKKLKGHEDGLKGDRKAFLSTGFRRRWRGIKMQYGGLRCDEEVLESERHVLKRNLEVLKSVDAKGRREGLKLQR